MIKFDVTNRWSGAVQFTAEIECAENATASIKLGLAVKWAVKAGAYLAGANLADANLADANLAGANLAGAYLARANLARANLADANLARANLADAYLAGAYLARANLADANLADANLADAYLAGAYLAGANLARANLADANLADAKWRDGITLTRAPIQIYGLRWPVTILDEHMQIGCELHSFEDWAAFNDRKITAMSGKDSLAFWREHKAALMALTVGRAPAKADAA